MHVVRSWLALAFCSTIAVVSIGGQAILAPSHAETPGVPANGPALDMDMTGGTAITLFPGTGQQQFEQFIAQIGPDPNDIFSLNLSQTLVTDLSPLKKLTGLQYLILRDMKITDFSAVKDLAQLKMIDLSHTLVSESDIDALKKALPRTQIDH